MFTKQVTCKPCTHLERECDSNCADKYPVCRNTNITDMSQYKCYRHVVIQMLQTCRNTNVTDMS